MGYTRFRGRFSQLCISGRTCAYGLCRYAVAELLFQDVAYLSCAVPDGVQAYDSVCIAVPLMIFFGIYFLLARIPDKTIFANYLRSRRIMGCALLLLAANYLIHFLSEVRFPDIDVAILLNLSTYFLCYWLFSLALTTLLDHFYITRRRCAAHFTL